MENIQAKQKKKKGFTLIELIIVIAILGILALIAIPKFGSAQKEAKIKADIASAKIIADTTTKCLAEGKLQENDKDNEIKEVIKEEIQGGMPKVQYKKDSNPDFTVELKNGNVTVKVGEIQVYPDSKDYK